MNNAVLVLNANYEPVNIIGVRRAVTLILSERALLVANGRGYIHSVTMAYPLPSVIRLSRMIRRPRLTIRLTRREVFRRDDYICQYCGKHCSDPTVDHVIPRYRGGRYEWRNVVTACAACNHRKGGRTVEEAGMTLLHSPKEPPASAAYVFGRHMVDNQEWEPFLAGW